MKRYKRLLLVFIVLSGLLIENKAEILNVFNLVTNQIQQDDSSQKNGYENENEYDIPKWDGSTSTVSINDDVPSFTEEQKALTNSQIVLSDLDSLGRCQSNFAVLGTDTLATEKRGSIGMVKPSGWQTVRYDDLIKDKYLYNRCHLIGYSLSSLLSDENNLITGTRSMNLAMVPYENEVHNYIEDTGNHVLYRATPLYSGVNLVADGVLLEAYSLEDEGAGIQFYKYFYNEQPNIVIDHSDGSSHRKDE